MWKESCGRVLYSNPSMHEPHLNKNIQEFSSCLKKHNEKTRERATAVGCSLWSRYWSLSVLKHLCCFIGSAAMWSRGKWLFQSRGATRAGRAAPCRTDVSSSVSTKGRLKQRLLFGGHHVGGEYHKRLPLPVPSLSLRYIFRSSVLLQAHTSVNFTETHVQFILV
jgi:hypothetical protein